MNETAPGATATLRLTRLIKASRERVFRAWTEPDELRRWWGAGDHYDASLVEIDLRVGGRYRFGMKPRGKDIEHIVGGTFREVVPPERLVYTWAWEGPSPFPGETLVTIELFDRAGDTELVLTHEKFADASARDEHVKGWTPSLDKLLRYCEV